MTRARRVGTATAAGGRVVFRFKLRDLDSSIKHCLILALARKRQGVDNSIARSHSWYIPAMDKEKPSPLGSRVYNRHRILIKKAAKQLKISEAEVVRRALELFVT